MSSAQQNQQQVLPKKEAEVLRSVVTFYETKQYKKGLKAVETILKRFPKHGETLCMKGLLLNCTGKKEEAVSIVKAGLTNDMRSHVCWHVYGLIHRSERNYNEAIKAYKQALRIDSGNLQILRDLSLLQIQMRDLHGFTVTRHTILSLKPNQMIHWLTFAFAKHLTGHFKEAVDIIDIYKGTLDKDAPEVTRGFEGSELLLYQNELLAKIPNNFQNALEHLETHRNLIVDDISYWSLKGFYLLSLSRFDEAVFAYVHLLQMGITENYSTHAGIMCAILQVTDTNIILEALELRDGMGTLATMIPLTTDQRQLLLLFYLETLSTMFPKSNTIARIPLTLFEGKSLHNALNEYIRKNLTRGVPSLGYDLSSLFLIQRDNRMTLVKDPADVRVHPTFIMITELVDSYLDALEKESRFPPKVTTPDMVEPQQPPSTLLWSFYLRAVLHEVAGEYTQAIEFAEKCLKHTSTAVDMYELMGRLRKAAGDINGAADILDTGRELDKQDRYINNLTTLYLLQANREDEALERISLFTRHESPPEKNIFDMQCTWYELELAACYYRNGFYGKSLKKYMAVEKHFDDFHDDQFDFHSYCIRKSTFRAYRDFLNWEDNLWGHNFYCTAAGEIIRIYLFLYDHPVVDTALDNDTTTEYSKMSGGERKRAKAIARKKKKQDSLEVKENDGAAGPDTSKIAVDSDPDGQELVARDPLEEAKKFTSTLVKNASHRQTTWILQYDVAIRRGKWFMALQALLKAKALDADDGDLFSRTVDFLQRFITRDKNHYDQRLDDVLQKGTDLLLGAKDMSLQDFIFMEANKVNEKSSIPLSKRLSVSKSSYDSGIWTATEASSFVVSHKIDGHGTSFDVLSKCSLFLAELGHDATHNLEKWEGLINNRFPFAKD